MWFGHKDHIKIKPIFIIKFTNFETKPTINYINFNLKEYMTM